MIAETKLDELVDVCRSRPGRGGVRLAYRHAETVLQLVALVRELGIERGYLRATIRRQAEQQQRLELALAEARARLAEALR